MKYLLLTLIFTSDFLYSQNLQVPLTNDSILVLNSFYVLFIIAGFFLFGVEQVFILIKMAKNA